jgi:RimJ/RimL family protein N-acetyltransferase
MIESGNIYLRPMEIEDVPYKVRWINDPDVRRTLNFDYPISKVATEQWLRKVATDSSRKDFIACLKSNNIPIGYGGFLHIDYKNLKAESYMGIGAKEYWGSGNGYQLKKALLVYAFDHLRLNRVYSYHLTDNKPMIKINLKLGGKEEGIVREDVYSNGALRDRILLSVLKDEMIR